MIYAVVPDDLNRAFIAFLGRDRQFSEEHFYRTHSGSRSTLLWLAQNHPEIKLNIIESSYTQNKLQFARIEFENKKQLVAYLVSLQLSEIDIIKLIEEKL